MGERSSGKAFGAKTLRLILRLRLINEQFKSPDKDKTCQAVHCRIIHHRVDRFGCPRLGAKYFTRQVVCLYLHWTSRFGSESCWIERDLSQRLSVGLTQGLIL